MSNEGDHDIREDGEVAFVKNLNGTWDMIQDDPDDPEFELITPVKTARIYTKIEAMKQYGWKVRQGVDLDFEGFILYIPKPNPPRDPRFW